MAKLKFDADTQEILQKYGFDPVVFERLRARITSKAPKSSENHVKGAIRAPAAGDVADLPALGSPERERLTAAGNDAIAAGEVAMVVLAGGMATRFGGVVKATVPALGDQTFLQLKLADAEAAAKRAGGTVPILFMTSFATDAEIRRAIAAEPANASRPTDTFAQHISARLTPNGDLFLDTAGKPSLHATGHGDLPSALRRSGALGRLREAGVKQLVMSNVDNLTATLDPALIAMHREAKVSMSVENAPKVPGDAGGAPAFVDDVLQIVEGFRFPPSFNQESIPVFNTNTLIFETEALDREFDFTWFTVTKKVEGNPVIQFERLVGELSALMPAAFFRVQREGADARFQPVKDPAELQARQEEIAAVLRARGIVS
ncbi:MAG: UTP--glucose-1-phosphate uridylyltransferase [Polyangiales bacterium]|jgi:UTP--glucose-1-phosphate uridylyltransferase